MNGNGAAGGPPGGAPGRPSRARAFWIGARPRTLGASIVPVLVGSAPMFSVPRFLLCLAVGLGMQVGVNYANDLFDGMRGVDTAERLGPPRLVASGWATPTAVATAAAAAFAVAGGAGLVLALLTTPWLIAIGVVAMAAAILYSGGPKPYAGLGLGELSVFVFFGLVATVGSAYVQYRVVADGVAELDVFNLALPEPFASLSVPPGFWFAGAAVGLIAVAILVANNLRDIPTDEASGKRTLAVRLGESRTRMLFAVCILGAPLLVVLGVVLGELPFASMATLLAVPLGVRAIAIARRARGRELIGALLATAGYQAVFGVFLAGGLHLAIRHGLG